VVSAVCEMHAVSVFIAPVKATLESGLMISSHGDHQVP
jgi:hypothetical protein